LRSNDIERNTPRMAMLTRSQIYTSVNNPITSGLFCEGNIRGSSKVEPVFSAYGGNPNYVNLQALYVKFCKDDPSEYTFAMTVFGEWKYWSNMKSMEFFKPILAHYVEEAEVARKSEAFGAVIQEIKEEGKSKFQAAKFLIDEPWKDKKDPKVKKDSKKTTTKAADLYTEDFERMQEEGLIN